MQNLPEALQKLLEASRLKQLPKGQIIFHEGDEPKEAYIIKTGVIKVYNIDEAGNEKILHLIGPGGILPFSVFTDRQAKTQWFYTSLTAGELYRIDYEELQELMDADSATTRFLTRWFSLEVHELLSRLDSMSRTNVHDKLVAALKFLAFRHSTTVHSVWKRVNFPVSHQLLADMTGVTRESAATVMKELSDARAVRNPGLTVLEINATKL